MKKRTIFLRAWNSDPLDRLGRGRGFELGGSDPIQRTPKKAHDALNGKYVAWGVPAREKANLTCEMPKALVKHPMGGISVFCKDLEMAGQFLHATGQFMHVGQAATIFTMELPEALAEHIFQPGAALKLVTPATFCQSNNIIVKIPETPQQRQAGPQSIDKQVNTAS